MEEIGEIESKKWWSAGGVKEIFKHRLLFMAKYAVGLIILGWLLWRFDYRQIAGAISSFSLHVIIGTALISATNLSLQFYRWQYLIYHHSNDYEKQDLIPSFFAGFAFRLMIPGGHAEISKIFLIPGKKTGKIFAFGLEKYFETYIKFVFILLALPVVFAEYRLWLWPGALAGITVYFFLPAIMEKDFLGRYQEKEVNYHRVFSRVLLFSLGVFTCLVLQYYFLLNDKHSIGLLDTVLTAVFLWGAGLIPISVSGLGVRESFAVYFLGRLGIGAPIAVGVSLFVFSLNVLLPALIGVIFIYRRRKYLNEAGVNIKEATKTLYQNWNRDK